eukprot:CAMPEP_0204080890 /NCGR_PEP_ID=MMETSP0360-20130528/174689_1 /ASSEMBLY_ACC=CAM_ASM_000342 /TAXON_ID=268821 /ORGANISM="Scrippsiella Hangoei, Strain SHTV-5" /LENGTH=36 /DNA_ID= /DNA_START= /DNA_END= /DNA_ORIENTATION=
MERQGKTDSPETWDSLLGTVKFPSRDSPLGEQACTN